MARRKYDADSIDVLEFPGTVRGNPGMYMGETGAAGILQCFKEILGNATDEMTECGGGRILVCFYGDLVVVADEGRGIPVETHRKTKKATVETVMTHLHAGGKIRGSKNAYGSTTIGVHGVGASAVNALADTFDVYTYRNKTWYCIQFAKGVRVRALCKAAPSPSLTASARWKTGTVIAYRLDKSIMSGSLDVDDAMSLCDISRHFLPVDIELVVGKRRTSLVRKTPEALLKRSTAKETLDSVVDPLSINAGGVRFVGCWTNASDTKIAAHVAGAVVPSGTHVRGLEEAVRAAVRSAAPREAKDTIDVLVGFRAVLDVSVDAPEFSGQVKSSLKTASARAQVVGAVQKELTRYLRRQKSAVRTMLEHAAHVSAIDAQHSRLMDMARSASSVRGRLSFPKGAMVALSFPAERRELFICEGRSAGGSLKKAKMPWQEVLPLRGKMANVINRKGAVESSEAVGGILSMVGYDPRKPEQKPRVGKIIILTDADDDGDHISVLLMTIFQQVMPSLLRDGRVYIVDLPLFEARTRNGDMVTGDNLEVMKKTYGALDNVNRMKGLASCEVSLLSSIATDPDTRRLIQIAAPSTEEAHGLKALMGADSAERKKLLHSREGTKDEQRRQTAPQRIRGIRGQGTTRVGGRGDRT